MKLSYYLLETILEDRELLLISTRTGTYLVLNQELADNFFYFKTTMNENDLNVELKEALIEFEMLIDDKKNEYQLILDVHTNERKKGGKILDLILATTLSCNLRCGYCFEQNKQAINLTSEDEDKIFQFVTSRLKDVEDGMEVSWFGGEPLLGIKSIERLSKRFIKLCTFQGKLYGAFIVTNGVLLNHENAKILKDSLVSSVQITIDGDRDTHNKMRPAPNNKGSYDDVINGILIAKEYFNVTIRINLNRNNIDSIPSLLHELAALELFDIAINFSVIFADDYSSPDKSFLTHEEFAIEEVKFSKLASSLGFNISAGLESVESKVSCKALNPNHYIFEPRGYVHKCVSYLGDNSKAVGKIEENSFSPLKPIKIWKNYDIFTLHQPDNEDDCLTCKYLPLCYGGCPKNRMAGYDKRKYICIPSRFNLIDMVKLEIGVS